MANRTTSSENRRGPLIRSIVLIGLLLAPHVAANGASWHTDGAPVVAIHYQDLPPGWPDTFTIAILDPELDDPTDIDAVSLSGCLAAGTPFNTAYEVWRVPVTLAGPSPCEAVVVVSARTASGTWRGAALVALTRVADIELLPPDSGLTTVYSSRSDSFPDDAGREMARLEFEEIAFENASSEPITLVRFSAGDALSELFGELHERFEGSDGTTTSPLPTRSDGALAIILPGESRTFGVRTNEHALLEGERSTLTIGWVPTVRIGGIEYYVEGLTVTSFPGSRGP